MTEYFDDLAALPGLDWEVLNAAYWNDTADDADRMRRRMAEFLVHDHLPLASMLGVATMTERTAEQVTAALGPAAPGPVLVRPHWYY